MSTVDAESQGSCPSVNYCPDVNDRRLAEDDDSQDDNRSTATTARVPGLSGGLSGGLKSALSALTNVVSAGWRLLRGA